MEWLSHKFNEMIFGFYCRYHQGYSKIIYWSKHKK